MASFLYGNYKNLMLGNGTHTRPDLDTDIIKCGIISGSDYSELATHEDWADTGYSLDQCYNSEATQTLTSGNITIGVVADGVFDCSDIITFTAVAIVGAKVVDAVAHYRSGGTAATDTLICFHDGFSITPNSSDISVEYNVSGIFGL